jgi:hypothetical protein
MPEINENVLKICKLGQGALCCKYLVMGSEGFECMKIDTENKKVIDENWKTVEHVAQGDNCEGKEQKELN